MYWIFAGFFFAMLYYFPNIKAKFKQIEKKKEPEKRTIPYENTYMLNACADESDELKSLGVVEELTPEGKVRMKWEDQFLYWAERPIQYKYLETVARKYVIVYQCKENYINIFAELAKAYNKPEVEVKQNTAFATFKSYNTINKKLKVKHRSIINEKSNQYKWKGKISEFDKPIVSEIRRINFQDYKKI
jgi:hypothetical protein